MLRASPRIAAIAGYPLFIGAQPANQEACAMIATRDGMGGEMNQPIGPGAPRRSSHQVSIPLYLILTLVTLFIFNLYWNYRQMAACNDLLGRPEFSWLTWILLTILTCGIYHLFYQYKMGAAINEIQHQRGLPVTEGLPALSVVSAVLGVGVVADCIHQYELNKIDA
jgi:hypothetical protein